MFSSKVLSTSCDDLKTGMFFTFIPFFFAIILAGERNAQKQAELAKERDELNRSIQENKLLDEQEKTRLGLMLSPVADFLSFSLRNNSVKTQMHTQGLTLWASGFEYPVVVCICFRWLHQMKKSDQIYRSLGNTDFFFPFTYTHDCMRLASFLLLICKLPRVWYLYTGFKSSSAHKFFLHLWGAISFVLVE